jgi:hypothetical protein
VTEYDRDELRLRGEGLLFNGKSDFQPTQKYLQRAVQIVRDWNAAAIFKTKKYDHMGHLDRFLRWALTESGPQLLLKERYGWQL